jgi:hypothetical protein
MIEYQTYCQIRHLFTEKQLGLRQIARQLKLGLNTVRKWARRESFKRAPITQPSRFSSGSKNGATRAATRSSRRSCVRCAPNRDRLS